jgi:hypothetical protein
MRPLVPFKIGKKSVKDKKNYKNENSGEIEFDLKSNMRKIRNEMTRDNELYDKIKATDVPYKWVVLGFIVFLFLMAVGSYIGQSRFKISLKYILWANVAFFFVQVAILTMITFYCFKQEEVRDCKRLA